MNETFFITPELSSVTQDQIYIPSNLKEGYGEANIVNPDSFYVSGKSLDEYLKEQIIIKFADEQFSFVGERQETKSTNYIQNDRRLKLFFLEDSSKTPRVFVFDITSCV